MAVEGPFKDWGLRDKEQYGPKGAEELFALAFDEELAKKGLQVVKNDPKDEGPALKTLIPGLDFDHPPVPVFVPHVEHLLNEDKENTNLRQRIKECQTGKIIVDHQGYTRVAPLCNASLEWMPPDDFLYFMPPVSRDNKAKGCECAYGEWHCGRNRDKRSLAALMLKHEPLDVGFVNFTEPWDYWRGEQYGKHDAVFAQHRKHTETYVHEGRHRAVVARELGVPLIPVLTIRPNKVADKLYADVTGEPIPGGVPAEAYRGERLEKQKCAIAARIPQDIMENIAEVLPEGEAAVRDVVGAIRKTPLKRVKVAQGEEPDYTPPEVPDLYERMQLVRRTGKPFAVKEKLRPRPAMARTAEPAEYPEWRVHHLGQQVFDALRGFGMAGTYKEHERIPRSVWDALPEFYKADAKKFNQYRGMDTAHMPYAGEVYEYFKYVLNNDRLPDDYDAIRQAGRNVPLLDLGQPKVEIERGAGPMLEGMLQQAKLNELEKHPGWTITEAMMQNARAILNEAKPGADQVIVDWVLSGAAVNRAPHVVSVNKRIGVRAPKTKEVNGVIDELLAKARRPRRHRAASRVAAKLGKEMSHMFKKPDADYLRGRINRKRMGKKMVEDFAKAAVYRPGFYATYLYLKAVANGDFVEGMAPDALMLHYRQRGDERAALYGDEDKRRELLRLMREGVDLEQIRDDAQLNTLKEIKGAGAEHPEQDFAAAAERVAQQLAEEPPVLVRCKDCAHFTEDRGDPGRGVCDIDGAGWRASEKWNCPHPGQYKKREEPIEKRVEDERDAWVTAHRDVHFRDIPKMLIEDYRMKPTYDDGERINAVEVWWNLPLFARDDLSQIQNRMGDDIARMPYAGLVLQYFKYLIGNRSLAFPFDEKAQGLVLGAWPKSVGVNLLDEAGDYLKRANPLVMEQVEKWPTKQNQFAKMNDNDIAGFLDDVGCAPRKGAAYLVDTTKLNKDIVANFRRCLPNHIIHCDMTARYAFVLRRRPTTDLGQVDCADMMYIANQGDKNLGIEKDMGVYEDFVVTGDHWKPFYEHLRRPQLLVSMTAARKEVAKNAKKAYTIPKVKDMTIPEPLEKGMPIYDEDVIGADEGDLLAVEQEAQERASRERHLAEEKAAEYDKRIADQIASEERKRGITGEQYNEVKPGVFIKVHRDGNPIQGWDVIMAAHKNIASIWKDPKDPWLGMRLDRFDQQFRRNLQLIWGKKAANHQPNAFDHAALLELGERVDDRDIRPNEAEWLRDRAYRIAQMYRRGELKI